MACARLDRVQNAHQYGTASKSQQRKTGHKRPVLPRLECRVRVYELDDDSDSSDSATGPVAVSETLLSSLLEAAPVTASGLSSACMRSSRAATRSNKRSSSSFWTSNSSRVTRSSRENVCAIMALTLRSMSAAGLLAINSE